MSYLTMPELDEQQQLERLAEARKLLAYIGIYLATHASKVNHLKVGMEAARELGLYSLQTQELLTIISAVDSFGIDNALKNMAEQTISKSPIADYLHKLVGSAEEHHG